MRHQRAVVVRHFGGNPGESFNAPEHLCRIQRGVLHRIQRGVLCRIQHMVQCQIQHAVLCRIQPFVLCRMQHVVLRRGERSGSGCGNVSGGSRGAATTCHNVHVEKLSCMCSCVMELVRLRAR